jgi:DNA polymerase-3 subunit epsilon
LDQDAPQRQRSEADPVDAVTKLKLGTAAVIDVETTGLSLYRDEIVELAITIFRYDRVKGQVLEVVSEYSGLREPSCPIRRDATAVHGITRRMVRGLNLDYPRIRAMLRQADFIVAHNARFDRGLVERLMPSFRNKTWLCSLNGIDWEAKGFRSRRLEDLATAHEIENPCGHRASGDTETLLALLSHRPRYRKAYLHELLRSAGII